MPCIFAGMIIFVNILWVLWAPDARKYIRYLRNSGGERPDEKKWVESVGGVQTRYRWFKDPLTIKSIWIPRILCVGWIIILVYFVTALKS